MQCMFIYWEEIIIKQANKEKEQEENEEKVPIKVN